MLVLKSKNSITGLLVALVLLVGIYMAMDKMVQQSKVDKTVELPEPGRSILSDDLLTPFRDKWSSQDTAKASEALAKIGHRLQELRRSDFEGYLAVNIDLAMAEAAPLRYLGQALPLTFSNAGNVAMENSDGFGQFRTVTSEGRTFRIALVQNYAGNVLAPVYAEVILLGVKKTVNSPSPLIEGVALEFFELPKDGKYPQMASDALALSLVVDDMSSPELQKLTRSVSSQVMSHFFAKAQTGEMDKMPMVKASYSNLMETPDRFRAQKVEFTGTLIFTKKNRLKDESIPPGMDMYEEGILLNSDSISYVFRAPKIPSHLKIKDIVRVEGTFLQRYNYLNRLGRATWTPLILASKIEKIEEPKVVMTSVEKNGVLTILILCAVAFLWIIFRKRKFNKPVRVHKPTNVPKKDGSSVPKKDESP